VEYALDKADWQRQDQLGDDPVRTLRDADQW